MSGRRPDHIPARSAIPAATKREVFKRSGGLCEHEGCTHAGKEIDHIKAQAMGGGNELENLQLLCREHHLAKTAGDVGSIAKADRQGGRSGQYKRRTAAKVKGKHKAIQSGGFQTNRDGAFKQKIGGEVVRRG